MVDEVLALIFAGGKRLQNTIAATAGNVVTNLSPATSKRWMILRGVITIITDATVANRQLLIEITDGTSVTEPLYAGAQQAASLTRIHGMGEAMIVDQGSYGVGQGYIGIRPIIIEGADQIRFTLSTGQAGDSYSGFVVVLEL